MDTFLPLELYPLEDRRKRYGLKNAVAEVTVDYAVPDVSDLVVTAYEASGAKIHQILRADLGQY